VFPNKKPASTRGNKKPASTRGNEKPPSNKGLSLVWDATVKDTFAQGHYKDSARQAGFAATKCQKYHDIQNNYHLQPVAIETTGVWQVHCPFLNGLSKKFDVSGNASECQWLHQHLSLAVVRGNAASILACVRV